LRALPNNLAALKALAKVQLAMGDIAEAQSTLNDAGRQAAADVKELVAVARLLAEAGAFEEAEHLVRRAIAEAPGSRLARLTLAELKAQQRLFNEAAAAVEAVLEADAEDVRALALLGDIRMAQGRYDVAAALYQQALSVENRPDLVVSLYRALVRAGKAGEALRVVQAWHQANPGTPLVMRVLADHLGQTGDKSVARRLYGELVAVQPDNAELHNNLANLLLPVDSELALKTAMRAHELAPQNAAILDTLGWMLVQLGELERGLAHLRDAVARDSRIPTIRYHLAVALQEYGNIEAARAELRRALAMEAPFPEREDARRRLQLLESRG
jgi:tetratricopeptide (TPR) repeat protein